MAITYRRVKGSPLSSDEVDDNFQELSDDVDALAVTDAAKLNIDGSNSMTGDLDLNSHDIKKIANIKDPTNVLLMSLASRILYDNTGAAIVNFYSRTNGFGIQAGSWAGYFKTTNLTTLQTLEFPNQSGTIALTTDVSSALSDAEAYADALVVGLWDDRGNYNASVNTFPASGGSGSAGAVKKGDIWTVSVAGTLGGHAVTAGDTARALVDTPGQTDSNWAIAENNIGYVAENSANKDTDGTLASNSDTKYPSQKAVKTYTDTGLALKASASSVATNTTDIATLSGSLNSAYVALVDGATIAVDFLSKAFSNKTLTSSRTTITFTISNDLLAGETFIEYTKTTASDCVLTFPASSKIVDQNGSEVVGVAVTVSSTASGVFAVSIKKASTGYWVIIKRFVA
jgi:hypothetical protein